MGLMLLAILCICAALVNGQVPPRVVTAQYSCTKIPYKATCTTGFPSQFTLRWYQKDGKCCSYPYGHCKGEDDTLVSPAIRTKADCEAVCIKGDKSQPGEKGAPVGGGAGTGDAGGAKTGGAGTGGAGTGGAGTGGAGAAYPGGAPAPVAPAPVAPAPVAPAPVAPAPVAPAPVAPAPVAPAPVAPAPVAPAPVAPAGGYPGTPAPPAPPGGYGAGKL